MNSRHLLADSFAKQMIRFRWVLLAIAIVTAVFAFFLSRQLDFDRSIESMFAPDDPILVPYRELKRQFVGNEIVLAVYDDEELLARSGDGIMRLSGVAKELHEVAGVKDVLSLAEVNGALNKLDPISNFISGDKPRFPIVDPEKTVAREFLEIFEGYTHSPDGKTVSIVCLLDPVNATSETRQDTIRQLRAIMNRLPHGQLTGEPVLVSDGFDFVEKDGQRLAQTSICLLAVVIILCFRSIRWLVIPIAVVYWALWVSRSVIVLLGLQMSMVSSMLAAIVTVIGVATVIHIIVRYREARSDHLSKKDAIQRALSLLIVPIFWACATDAAGFSSLLFADTGPVRDFGLMMAIASMCVLVGIVLIVPGMSLLGSMSFDPKIAWGESNLKSALRASTGIMKRRATAFALIIAAAFIVVSAGIFRLKVETDFTKNFKPGTEIYDAYEFVEERMGGAGVLDVMVPAPKSLTAKYMQRVDDLENELRELTMPVSDDEVLNNDTKALKKVVSLVDLDRAAKSLVPDLPDFLPDILPDMMPEARYKGMAQLMPTFASVMHSNSNEKDQPDFFRIMLRTSQRGNAEQQQELIRRISEIANRHFPKSETSPGAETTGIFVLLANLVNRLLSDQVRTFVVANIFIFVVMLLALRSFRLAAIAMIPNVIPILMLMGVLGWCGIKLNMGAVMIAAVSIGLSIDSSIHYLFAFQRWRSRGHSVFESIQQSQHRVGRAAMYSTLALVAGFSTLCFSQFVPTVYFGGLVSLSMLGGLFGNLVVLPIVLLLVFKHDSGNELQ